MRIHLLFIIAIAMLALSLPARAYDPEFAKIVSYSKLMQLSPEKRAEYIRQVRLMVSELEDLQKVNAESSPAEIAKAIERNFFLEMFIQEAEALGRGAGVPATRTRRLPVYNCPRSLTSKVPRIMNYIRNDGSQMACLDRKYAACAPGFREIGGWQGSRVCYKYGPGQIARARAQKEAARRRELQAQEVKRAQEARTAKANAEAKRTRQARAARDVATTNGPRRRVARRDDGDAETRQPASRRERRETRNRPIPPETTPTDVEKFGDADADTDDETETQAADDDAQHVVTDLPAFTIADRAVLPISPSLAVGDDSMCKDAISPSAPDKCNKATIDRARTQFYRDDEPHCIYAGNLRHYANRQKKPGQCQPPGEFCLTSVSCKRPDGSFIRPQEGRLSCTTPTDSNGGKTIMCNPLIFNLDENDKALCIAPTKNATAECDRRAQEVQAAKGDKYLPFINRLKMAGSTDANEKVMSLSGIQDAWDEFAKHMNAICSDAPSKDLYCRECQVMKKRAAILNLAAFNGGQPDRNGNCYNFRSIDGWNGMSRVRTDRSLDAEQPGR